MGYVKGDKVRFYSGGIELSLEMEVSLNLDMDTIETSDKDSGGWKTFEDGDKEWDASGTANLDWSATENVSQTFSDFTVGDAIEVDVGSADDTKFYAGSALITNWNLTGPRNGLATFSFAVKGTGPITEGTTT